MAKRNATHCLDPPVRKRVVMRRKRKKKKKKKKKKKEKRGRIACSQSRSREQSLLVSTCLPAQVVAHSSSKTTIHAWWSANPYVERH